MAGPPASAPPSDMGPVWVIFAIFLVGAMVWYFAHVQIVTGYFYVKRFEIELVQFFIKGFGFPGLEKVKIFVSTVSPQTISFSELTYVANEVSYYLRFPIAFILVLLAVLLFYKSTIDQYKQVYSMTSLLRGEVQNWPQSTPVMGLDLVKADIDKGPWAMAMAPMMFAKRYKLIREEAQSKIGDRLSVSKHIQISLLKDRAARIFIMQLGRPWFGADHLNDHTKALFAIFAARAARDSERSLHLLKQLSHSSSGGHLDFSGVDEVIKKYGDFSPVAEIIEKHGYVFTIMASMLQLARSDGVLPTAEFLWLKPVDRKLWFMLNAVGRQTAVVEIAGPFAHWLAEKEIGRKLKTPMVEQAVKGLDLALQEVIYTRDDE